MQDIPPSEKAAGSSTLHQQKLSAPEFPQVCLDSLDRYKWFGSASEFHEFGLPKKQAEGEKWDLDRVDVQIPPNKTVEFTPTLLPASRKRMRDRYQYGQVHRKRVPGETLHLAFQVFPV